MIRQIVQVVGSLLIWSSIYVILRRFLKTGLPAHFVSLIHSLVSVTLIQLYKSQDNERMDFDKPTSNYEESVMCMTIGYFLYDTVIMEKCRAKLTMLIHHIGSILSLIELLKRGTGGSVALPVILLLEASNPLLHLRRILIQCKFNRGTLFFLLELVYMLIFLYFRFVIGGKITYEIMTGIVKAGIMPKCATVFLNVVSCVFVGDMGSYLKKKFSTRI